MATVQTLKGVSVAINGDVWPKVNCAFRPGVVKQDVKGASLGNGVSQAYATENIEEAYGWVQIEIPGDTHLNESVLEWARMPGENFIAITGKGSAMKFQEMYLSEPGEGGGETRTVEFSGGQMIGA